MTRIPYFNFYPADFMQGVRGLKEGEVGIYIMLLCRMYEENGPVSDNIPRLAAYCGCKDRVLTQAVERLVQLGKITLQNGTLSNARAMEEIEARNRVVKNSSKAGKISAEKRQQNQATDSTPVQQVFNHTDTDTEEERRKSSEDKSSGAFTPPDPLKVMFDGGVKLLSGAGIPEAKARSLLGKWRVAHGAETVIVAISNAQREGAIDPVSFIEGCFRQQKKRVQEYDFWTGPKLN